MENWSIEHFAVSEEQSHLDLLRSMGRGGRYVPPGRYMRLVRGDETIMSNTPSEMRDLSPASGGAGTWRGGLGARRVWGCSDTRRTPPYAGERTITPPFGLAGGLSGGPIRLWLERPDSAVRRINSKQSFRVPADARLIMEAPGSGGYGPPSGRDPALVREDRADEYVTREQRSP